MRLDRLDLTRYGRFTEARVDFPPPATDRPDLHVIFGPNEAGKSTLFSAWLDLLYGIPLRTGYDFLHPGPTMQIGARLTHAGGVLEAVRIKRNGPSLQDANGQALPEAVMQSALSGLGRDGYAAMFSLDDDTLEQGGELDPCQPRRSGRNAVCGQCRAGGPWAPVGQHPQRDRRLSQTTGAQHHP